MPLMKGYSTTSPKRLAKRKKFRRRQILVAEEDHAVLEPGLPDGGDDVVAGLGGEIDA